MKGADEPVSTFFYLEGVSCFLFVLFFTLRESHKGPIFCVIRVSRCVMSIGYVALFASVLGFLFWNRAIKKLGANKAGRFINLMPVFSIILAVLFLDEKLMYYHLTGIIFVFAGTFVTSFKFSMVFRKNVKKIPT